MSTGWGLVLLVAALALAVQSVRVLVQLPQPLRKGRLIVLAVAALLGFAVGSVIFESGEWPIGPVIGLAVVELGPSVLGVARRYVKRRGDKL